MQSLEEIKHRAEQAVPGAKLEVIPNANPSLQPSLLLDHAHALAVAKFLRDDAALKFDFCSNVTGVDWLDRVVKIKVKVKVGVDEIDTEVDEERTEKVPGYLEAVYHLYSITLKHGPVVIRLRTEDRCANARLPSLTPVYRSAELQEREMFDLFGIHFDGHSDLRRILMWDEYTDYPMRKDYKEPDDYEYEPTPHGAVAARAKTHIPARPAQDGCETISQPAS